MRRYLYLLRVQSFMTQEAMASAMNITRQGYQLLENGSIKNMKLQYIIDLSKFLNIDIEALVRMEVRYINSHGGYVC